jgi:hypothetical protein
MFLPLESLKKHPNIKRHFHGDVLIALIFDLFYVLVAMVSTHILSVTATFLGMGDDNIISILLRLSGSFYLIVYIFAVIKSLSLILTDGLKELIAEKRELQTLMEKSR